MFRAPIAAATVALVVIGLAVWILLTPSSELQTVWRAAKQQPGVEQPAPAASGDVGPGAATTAPSAPPPHLSAVPPLESPSEAAASSALPDPDKPVEFPVHYGTNRKPIVENDVLKGFSNTRDDIVRYGTVRVSIPRSHKFGEIGSSWFYRVWTGKDDRLLITGLNAKSFNQFREDLRQELERESDAKTLLLYIHGYKNSFDDAAIRAAQLGWDLKHPGPTAFFSWPSRAAVLEYATDESTIEWSYPAIRKFVSDLTELEEVNKLHIIAHSMGNRALADLVEHVRDKLKPKIGQIILAAPDLDRDRFLQLAQYYPAISDRTTLYVSSRDLIIASARIFLFSYDRVGYVPPVTVVSGIDTIEVSEIDLSIIGHGYISNAHAVLYDMKQLLDSNTNPTNRPRLNARTENGSTYWAFSK